MFLSLHNSQKLNKKKHEVKMLLYIKISFYTGQPDYHFCVKDEIRLDKTPTENLNPYVSIVHQDIPPIGKDAMK